MLSQQNLPWHMKTPPFGLIVKGRGSADNAFNQMPGQKILRHGDDHRERTGHG